MLAKELLLIALQLFMIYFEAFLITPVAYFVLFKVFLPLLRKCIKKDTKIEKVILTAYFF